MPLVVCYLSLLRCLSIYNEFSDRQICWKFISAKFEASLLHKLMFLKHETHEGKKRSYIGSMVQERERFGTFAFILIGFMIKKKASLTNHLQASI